MRRHAFGATAIERTERARDVFTTVLLRSAMKRHVFGATPTNPPDVGDPETPPHGGDVWISEGDAENYATFIDGKVDELRTWLSLGEEPEDLAGAGVSKEDIAKFFLEATSFQAWAQKWELSMYEWQNMPAGFMNTWDVLVKKHTELKAYADEFENLLNRPVPGDPGPPPTAEVPKVGPGKNDEGTLVMGAVALGLLGLFLLRKK